jgi:KDO2-lipid IV(A) lauroyltransferase
MIALAAVGLFRAGIALAERLPAWLLYRLADAAGLLLSVVPSPPRRRLRSNLAQVLRRPLDSPEVSRRVRRVYQVQAANYVDLLRARAISQDEVARRVRPAGPGWEVFERAVAERRGAVLVTAHFGRIEWLSHYLGFIGVRLTLPVERLRPPALFDLLCRQRMRPGFTLVPFDVGLRPCLRALGRGELVVFFADWDPTGHGVLVDFFGQPARLPAGPAHIALRTGAPLLVGFAAPDEATGQSLAFADEPIVVERTGDVDADVRRTTQEIARRLERQIARHPGHWVLFHEHWPAGTAGVRAADPNRTLGEPRPAAASEATRTA